MVCPQCKYVMGEFDSQCPKCHGQGVEAENESEFDRAIIDVIDSGGIPFEGEKETSFTLDETATLPPGIQVVTDEETPQAVAAKSGAFTLDESNTLPPDFNLEEESGEVVFVRNAPGGYGLVIAGIVLFVVALAGFLVIRLM